MQRKKKEGTNLTGNLWLYYAAVGVILLGYLFLSLGDATSFTSLTLGPIVLVIGYLVVMPFALLFGVRQKRNDTDKPAGG